MVTSLAQKKKQLPRPKTEVLSQEELRTWWPFDRVDGKILEKLNIKLHKRLFKGLKKLIKDLFKPIFNLVGVLGTFFNVKGKIGVSGSAKKRRYFFYLGRHSLTSRSVKTDLKFLPI